jgi:hypothetical protein
MDNSTNPEFTGMRQGGLSRLRSGSSLLCPDPPIAGTRKHVSHGLKCGWH